MPHTATDHTPAPKDAVSRNGRAAPARSPNATAAPMPLAAPRKATVASPAQMPLAAPRKAIAERPAEMPLAAPRKPAAAPALANAARRNTATAADPARRKPASAATAAKPAPRKTASAATAADPARRKPATAAAAAKPAPRKTASAAPSAKPARGKPATATTSADPARRKPATATTSADPARRKPATATTSADPARKPATAARRPTRATQRIAATSALPAKATRRVAARMPAAPAVHPEAPSAPARLSGGIAVVKLLDSKQPMEALRKFLDRIAGEATMEEGQIVLGSAQLMLLPIAHENRGGDEVKQLLDLVLARWHAFPDRSGFHAQEFLRNAFAAVGDDRERLARLAALVPTDATSELRFNLAGAYAVVGDRPAMLRALEAALGSGTTAAQVRRDPDFTGVLADPGVIALLDRAAVPAIPVDVAPYVAPVRAALDALVDTLRELGEPSRLNPPATLEAVLAAERAKQIQLPNDYRALLTITDGMALCDHEFFGTGDYHSDTQLAQRARAFLEMSVSYGGIGMDECVPLASWGQPNNWLLYDPRGAVREGAPGYVVMLTADPWPMTDLADALLKIESSVRDARATN